MLAMTLDKVHLPSTGTDTVVADDAPPLGVREDNDDDDPPRPDPVPRAIEDVVIFVLEAISC